MADTRVVAFYSNTNAPVMAPYLASADAGGPSMKYVGMGTSLAPVCVSSMFEWGFKGKRRIALLVFVGLET